eukprot:356459-Chlamydomonas_euryale.AAC.2
MMPSTTGDQSHRMQEAEIRRMWLALAALAPSLTPDRTKSDSQLPRSAAADRHTSAPHNQLPICCMHTAVVCTTQGKRPASPASSLCGDTPAPSTPMMFTPASPGQGGRA